MPLVTSFEEACTWAGLDPKKVIPDVSNLPEKFRESITAEIKLSIINDAIRDGEDVKFDGTQFHFAWWELNSPSGFRFFVSSFGDSLSSFGSRFCFHTKGQLMHSVHTFPELWKSAIKPKQLPQKVSSEGKIIPHKIEGDKLFSWASNPGVSENVTTPKKNKKERWSIFLLFCSILCGFYFAFFFPDKKQKEKSQTYSYSDSVYYMVNPNGEYVIACDNPRKMIVMDALEDSLDYPLVDAPYVLCGVIHPTRPDMLYSYEWRPLNRINDYRGVQYGYGISPFHYEIYKDKDTSKLRSKLNSYLYIQDLNRKKKEGIDRWNKYQDSLEKVEMDFKKIQQ